MRCLVACRRAWRLLVAGACCSGRCWGFLALHPQKQLCFRSALHAGERNASSAILADCIRWPPASVPVEKAEPDSKLARPNAHDRTSPQRSGRNRVRFPPVMRGKQDARRETSGVDRPQIRPATCPQSRPVWRVRQRWTWQTRQKTGLVRPVRVRPKTSVFRGTITAQIAHRFRPVRITAQLPHNSIRAAQDRTGKTTPECTTLRDTS